MSDKERIAELELLKDPNNVHLAMLRGHVAKISRSQWLHLEGDTAQEMARLERAIARQSVYEQFGSTDMPYFCQESDSDWLICKYGLLSGILKQDPNNPNLVRLVEPPK